MLCRLLNALYIYCRFLVSSCFSNAKLASACAGIFYFLSYIPYAYISIKEDLSFEGLCGVMLKTSAVCIQHLYGEFFKERQMLPYTPRIYCFHVFLDVCKALYYVHV